MDLGYPMDRSTRPVPADLVGPAQRIASFLGGGGRAVVVTGPAPAAHRALLDSLLAGMPGQVTRIENRTGLPLALDGVLRQMGKVAESEGDERGLFFRTLAEQAYDDYSAVIAVEDAHTLTSLALTALARAPGLGGPDLPGMILVLTGEAGLLEKLDGPGLEGLRNSRRTLMVSLPAPDAALAPAVEAPKTEAIPTAIGAPSDDAVGWARGNLGLRGVVIAVFAGAVAAAGGLTWGLLSHAPKPPVIARAAPIVQAAGPAAGPAVGPVVGPGVPPPAGAQPLQTAQPEPDRQPGAVPGDPPVRLADTTPPDAPLLPDVLSAPPLAPMPVPVAMPEDALRREFDAFLNRAGRDTAKLTPGARESLFREYQHWRAREAGRAP